MFGRRDSCVSEERKRWESLNLQLSLGTVWSAVPACQHGLCLPAGMLTYTWGLTSDPGTSAAAGSAPAGAPALDLVASNPWTLPLPQALRSLHLLPAQCLHCMKTDGG